MSGGLLAARPDLMHRKAYIFLILTMVFWGGNSVAGKLAVGHISPMMLTTLRWVISLAVLLPLSWSSLRQDWPVIRRNLPLLTALGATGFTLFAAAMYSALTYTTAINAAIEQAGMPMIIFLANFILFRIRVGWMQIVGFVMTLVGIALTASNGELSRLVGLRINFGDALMLLAVLFYGAYTVALRFKPPIRWQSTIFILSAAASVTSLPFLAWEIASDGLLAPDATGWGVTVYAALFPSLIAQVLYIRGNELIGGNRASLFINLVPIFGIVLSVLILRESFHLFHLLSMALVLGGIWLAENSGRKQDAAAAVSGI